MVKRMTVHDKPVGAIAPKDDKKVRYVVSYFHAYAYSLKCQQANK